MLARPQLKRASSVNHARRFANRIDNGAHQGHFPIASKKNDAVETIAINVLHSIQCQVMNLPLKSAINVCSSGGKRLQKR